MSVRGEKMAADVWRATEVGADVNAKVESSDFLCLTVDDRVHAASQWLSKADAKALALFLYKWASDA